MMRLERTGGALERRVDSSRRMHPSFALALCLVTSPQDPAPSRYGRLAPGPHAVGFETMAVTDPSRPLDGAPRLLRLSVWHPVQPGTAGPRMTHGELAALRHPARMLADLTPEVVAEAVARLVASRPEQSRDRWRELLAAPSGASRGGEPIGARCPLLLHGSSMLATGPGNAVFAEFLATHGWVVAELPCFGALGPRWMDTDASDLETHARDFEVALAALRAEPRVDPTRLATSGHSWGSVGALLCAARQSDVRAVLSLDGSEETWREVLEAHPDFDPRVASVPYLRLCRADTGDLGFFTGFTGAPRARRVFEGLRHFDFVSNYGGSAREPEDGRWLAYQEICDLAYGFLSAPGTLPEGLEAPAHTPLRDAASVLDRVEQAGVAVAVAELDDAPATPEAIVRAAELLLWSGDEDAAEALLTWVLERHPSARGYEILGDTWWMRGDETKARTAFVRSAELGPGVRRVQVYLEDLK